MLKEVLDKKLCAECKNCCSFIKESIWETPRLNENHLKYAEKSAKFKKIGKHYYAEYQYKENVSAKCPFLDKDTGCIFPENIKPFDCKLWPLRIMKAENEIYLTLYDNCPAFTDKKAIDRLIRHINDKLIDKIYQEIRLYPDIIKPYKNNYIKLIKIQL